MRDDVLKPRQVVPWILPHPRGCDLAKPAMKFPETPPRLTKYRQVCRKLPRTPGDNATAPISKTTHKMPTFGLTSFKNSSLYHNHIVTTHVNQSA